MLDYLKKKSIGSFINLGAAVFALIMLIVYSVFASKWHVVDGWVITCIVLMMLINIALFVIETPFDEYLKVAASILSAFAAAIFFLACVGDISDYVNNVVYMGVGMPIKSIITMTVFMGLLVIANIVPCAFGRKKK